MRGDEGSRLFDETVIARHRHRKWAAAAAGALVLFRLLAEVAPVMRRPDLALLDFWQSVRGTDSPSPQIAIVGVDEKSVARFGPPAWPRSEYVPLVEKLSSAGARVIGFDFTFGALERERENNELFAAAMKKAGNVVFGYEFVDVGDPSPPGTAPSESLQKNALETFESIAIPPAPSLIEPEPVLAEAAAAIGHVRTVASEDGRIRVVPLFVKHGEKVYSSLALQIARVYTQTPMEEVELRSGSVRMGEWEIPVTASGEVLLDWPAGGEQAFPMYSFLDVVRGDVPNEAFQGKAVLVAGTASGLDDRDLPIAVEAPGVLIYATFLDNVFRFDFVKAPIWGFVLEWVLFLALCGLGVLLLPRLSTPLLLIGVPALAILLFGSSAFLFVQKGIWIKVFYPVLACVLPLGMTVLLRLTTSERETRDVAAEKTESQKLLGLSFQEKGMLDMALATFNKLPFTQDMKHVYLNLGLDYENRGQRDKAYVVYKKIFDSDPTFEDVAMRMERLSQAGASPSLFPIPATAMGRAPTPAPGQGTPRPSFSQVAATPPPPAVPVGHGEDMPTEMSPRHHATLHEEHVDNLPTQVEPARAPTPPPASMSGRSMGPAPSIASAPGGPLLPGSRFGRYEVEQHLGRGGMGDVYLVRDTVINRKAALKTIRDDTNLDPRQVIEMRQRFYREAQTAGKLTHPNIVTVYDVGEELGMSYIVMEYVDGNTLTQLMKKQRLTLPQIKHVITNAAMGLDYAHQNGVFHRDVKPDNVMVSKTGIVKVMDFGIARVVESNLTKTGSVMGTPSYMSPEQVRGQKVDARSDVFSLGVILYELLTGKKPFSGETMSALMFAIMKDDPTQPSALDTKISATWDEILRKALAKEPDARYASAREVAQAVRDAPAK
jgi:CHASE2 domain-containing sensor protein/tRNA A-37 threonylcarbamoyl transferase component Bud32